MFEKKEANALDLSKEFQAAKKKLEDTFLGKLRTIVSKKLQNVDTINKTVEDLQKRKIEENKAATAAMKAIAEITGEKV